jgi:hypothetical protein
MSPPAREGQKPRILFVLQGPHHLMLYENIFRYCTGFDWYCVLPGLSDANIADVERFYHNYGMKVFSDTVSALANMAAFDAVITTWAVPHRKHLPYLPFITIAQAGGIPVFEMQHGLFQLGLTYNEHAPVIGARAGAATCIAAAPNLVEERLMWFGPDSIGYPRTIGLAEDETPLPPVRRPRVTIISNHHWAILSESERQACYVMIETAIRSFPEVDFVLMPHGGELKSAIFKTMLENLELQGATHYRIENGRDGATYDALLHDSDLLLASVSTTILDCEMSGTPAVLLRNPSQNPLTTHLQEAVFLDTPEGLVDVIRDVLYRGYCPTLVTGYLEPFRPDRLEQRLSDAIARNPPAPRSQMLAAIAIHLGPVAGA